MSRIVVLATRNKGKIGELRRILAEADLDIDLRGTDEFPDMPDVAETGATFAANATLKSRSAADVTGLPAIADDSGLCVDALNGMPGILSARWAGSHGDDRANLDLVLAQTEHLPPERRGARFVCAAAVSLPGGIDRVVEGELTGRVIAEPRGANGFGYDPIFVPSGYEITTAQMDSVVKDSISHRGRAFRALAPVLQQLLAAA